MVPSFYIIPMSSRTITFETNNLYSRINMFLKVLRRSGSINNNDRWLKKPDDNIKAC